MVFGAPHGACAKGWLNQGRSKNVQGDFSSEGHAQTFADYLESVQWRVRPATVIDEPVYTDELHVALGPITLGEVKTAVTALRVSKAAGPDGHTWVFWKAGVENVSEMVVCL